MKNPSFGACCTSYGETRMGAQVLPVMGFLYFMDAKKEFIQNVIFSNTIQGAFQRVRIYNEEVSPSEKDEFKIWLRKCLSEVVLSYHKKQISSDEHLSCIRELQRKVGLINKNIVLSFGVTQKLLNLNLKYLWCWGELEYTPPHCPVDSFVLNEIGLRNKRWSKMDEAGYQQVLKRLNERAGHQKIAEWELSFFNNLSRS